MKYLLNTKKTNSSVVIICIGLFTLPVNAVTLFTNAVDTDFNNALNWDAGLPTDANGPGTIDTGANAIMTADFLMNNDSVSVTDIIINGTLSTGSNELQLRSGAVARTSDVTVNGTLNINNGGSLDIAGASADLFISGGGNVNVEDGGIFAASKTVDISSGSTLSFAAGAISGSSMADELQLRNNSTLEFDINPTSGFHYSISGNSLQVRLGSTPQLAIHFATAPTSGNNFDLITGVSDFTDFSGTTTGFTFDSANVTVTGLGAGQSYTLDYSDKLQLQIVPEPASTSLLGLGILGITLSRRR